MTKPQERIEEVLEIINKSIPCLDGTCDLNGTAITSSDGENPEPIQCEYCYRERFPVLNKVKEELTNFSNQIHEELAKEVEGKKQIVSKSHLENGDTEMIMRTILNKRIADIATLCRSKIIK